MPLPRLGQLQTTAPTTAVQTMRARRAWNLGHQPHGVAHLGTAVSPATPGAAATQRMPTCLRSHRFRRTMRVGATGGLTVSTGTQPIPSPAHPGRLSDAMVRLRGVIPRLAKDCRPRAPGPGHWSARSGNIGTGISRCTGTNLQVKAGCNPVHAERIPTPHHPSWRGRVALEVEEEGG
jgi:hypothetical protein